MADAHPDPWGDLSARYEHDEKAQFFLVVEQLAEARALVVSGVVARQRMALVAADNLAEVILHRHKRHAVRLADEAMNYAVPRLGATELREFGRDFGARVRFARRGGENDMSAHFLRPVLDDLDDAIFRTGHAYGNRVYHADHHNPTILPLITGAYLGAVGRAFTRQQPRQVASSVDESTRRALAAYGHDVDASESWGRGMFQPADAAGAIVARLTEGLQPELVVAKRELADDLIWRTEWADEMIDSLIGDGLPPERLSFGLAWSEFWAMHGHDDEIVRLDIALADAWQDAIDANDDAERMATFERRNDLSEQRNARIKDLLAGFRPTFELKEIDRVRRGARNLASARDIGSLFTRYQALDVRAQRIEQALAEAAIGWDRYVQEETDRLRGK